MGAGKTNTSGSIDSASPKRREKLTREEIGDAALALANEKGIESVTLREVARRLGVTPMALYKHIENKRELEEVVATALLGREFRTVHVSESSTGRSILSDIAFSLHDALAKHPALLRAFTEYPEIPEYLDHLEQTYEAFARLGIPVELRRTTTRIIGYYIVGSVFMKTNSSKGAFERLDALLIDIANGKSTEGQRYPRLIEAVQASLGRPSTSFETCTSIMLDLFTMLGQQTQPSASE